MYSTYLLCFAIGALLSVVMALLGAAHGVGGPSHHVGVHAGGHAHGAGAHAQAATHGHVGHGQGGHASSGGSPLGSALVWALSWLSPLTVGGFLLAFGAVGLLGGGALLTLPLAIVAGLALALGIRALMGAFVRASSPGLSATAEGAIGTISAAIRPGGTGEVSFEIEGQPRTVICRAENGALVLPRGTQVVITRRTGGYAYVEPLDPVDLSANRLPPATESGSLGS